MKIGSDSFVGRSGRSVGLVGRSVGRSVFVDSIFKPSCREVTSTVGVRNSSSNDYSRLLTVCAV
jgi:hypothetical protein